MWSTPGTRPRALSLESALYLTLAYFRHNVTDEFLASFFGVSQATVSRIISDVEVMIDVVLNGREPELRSAVNGTTVVVSHYRIPFPGVCTIRKPGKNPVSRISSTRRTLSRGCLWTIWGTNYRARIGEFRQ
ncbi:helix-turn-helix domain-containing protein [Rathayibacter toxicus]|uniref:helix-turn-helix domain-containing protein n=1 Tax=Rathayibacter toxicus TaxID=145458 RepID=UPI00389AFA98